MAPDLQLAIAAMSLASLGLGMAAAVLSRRLEPGNRLIAVCIVVVLLATYAVIGQDAVWIAHLLPSPILPVTGQLMLPLTAVTLGLAWPAWQVPSWRKVSLTTACVALTLYTSWHRLRPNTIIYEDRWIGEVCLQSIDGTCSAAACATLLRAHGIHSSEERCGMLALTQRDGTTMYGMYRALAVESAAAGFKPQVAMATLEDLHDERRLPALLSVALDAETAEREPRYLTDWHWTIGQRHSVVLLGWVDDRPIIADPAIGREVWHADGLADLWIGRMLYLAR